MGGVYRASKSFKLELKKCFILYTILFPNKYQITTTQKVLELHLYPLSLRNHTNKLNSVHIKKKKLFFTSMERLFYRKYLYSVFFQ